MSHRTLREVAKFCSGLIAADLVTLLWFWSANLFPIQTWGMTWTSDVILPAVVFDIALLIVLIHYGWHLGKIPRPKERSYLMVIGVILTVIAVAHLLRVFTNSDVSVMGWVVPMWLSWVGTAVAAYLAYASFYFAMRSR